MMGATGIEPMTSTVPKSGFRTLLFPNCSQVFLYVLFPRRPWWHENTKPLG
jgi:hypothetical protein